MRIILNNFKENNMKIYLQRFMNLYFIALLSLSGFYAFNYLQILNMDGWEMFDRYATENEKETKENLADQMLEANGKSDQQEVEKLRKEYKNIYIEVRSKAKKEFWDHKKSNWKIASILIGFLFVINYLLSGRLTLLHKSNN